MIATVPGVVTDVAAFCGALLVVVTFLAAISRLRWVRWTWRHLISDPLAGWLRGVVLDGAREWHAEAVEPRLSAIEAQLRTNGGSTLRDVVEVAAREAHEAKAWAQHLAEAQGFPPGMDPTARRTP
jgi:hypothetical protein